MLVQHHKRYKEIHGEDEIVMMDFVEHRELHKHLREEGKCTVPLKELHKISSAAYYRSPLGNKAAKEYHKSTAGKAKKAEWYKKNRRVISDTTQLGHNIRLVERIDMNITTGSMRFSSRFVTSRRKLIVIDI